MGAIIGVDEVGLGALAGPLVTAAVVLGEEQIIEGVNDSKKLKPHRRADLAPIIKESCLHWSLAASTAEQIDEYGRDPCLFACMAACVQVCLLKYPDAVVIVDGDRHIPHIPPSKQRVIEKADAKFQCVGAASIIAKVFRDRYMIEAASRYMVYDWQSNVGYGTKIHIRQIKKHGITEEHRKSYNPVREMLEKGKTW